MDSNESTISQDVLDGFEGIKAGEYRYAIFKINSSNEISVDGYGSKGSSYADFIIQLPENEGRYAVFDYEYLSEDKVKFTKLVFFTWSPDTIKVREKVKYSSNASKLKAALKGIACYMVATDSSELEESEILERVMK